MLLLVFQDQKLFKLVDRQYQAALAKPLAGAFQQQSKISIRSGRLRPDQARLQNSIFDAFQKLFIPPELNDYVPFAHQFRDHPCCEQGALAGTGRAGQIQDRLLGVFDPAKHLLVSVIDPLEFRLCFTRPQREVSRPDIHLDLAVALDAPLFEERRNSGEHQSKQRKRRKQRQAAPRR